MRKQKGLALLILVVVIALAFVTYTITELSITEVKVEQIKNTQTALQKAKNALIAYAVNYPKNHAPRGPGYFLCPDTDNDGDGETSCNGPSTVGRLPWRTLNIGDIRDSSNERLWYAVSQNFDYTASPLTGVLPRKVINTATRGNITVRDSSSVIYDGTTIDGVVAVIIAPGAALTRNDNVAQNRSNANVNNPVHYLDIAISGEDNVDFEQGTLGGLNNNGFVQGEILDAAGHIIVNDIIEVITYRDLMSQVHKRVSQEISNLIDNYFMACEAYPEAATFNPLSATFDSAGLTMPNELQEGHIPLNSAKPYNWGAVCSLGTAPLPVAWLEEERWDESTYYSYAYENAPPTNTDTCGNGSNPACMIINSSTTPINNVQALIMFSGRDISLNRPSNMIADYYEGENSNLDSIYDADESEDYIKVITP